MRSPSWNLKELLLERIQQQGGWVNAHCHLDKAYSISPEELSLAYSSLQAKWDIIDEKKRQCSVEDIYDTMALGVEEQLKQGVTALCSFIDVDPLIEDKAILAADRVRAGYGSDIELLFANQTIKGVIAPDAREWFDRAVEFVDIVGGLPGKDKGQEAEHIEILLQAAKRLGKMVHIHADQLNLPSERETELIARKTAELGMAGRVVVVHGISLAAQPEKYRQQVYRTLKEQQIGMIACPTAWIDHRRSEEVMPFHNAVTPVDELIPAGIPVAIGPDDIADYYKPFTDGDMWTELRFLLESCHYYELDELVKISTTYGRQLLGLEVTPTVAASK